MLLYESIALTVIGFFVLRALVRKLRSRKGAYVYFGTALSVYVPWLLQHLHVPLLPLAAVSAGAWVLACLVWFGVGLPWLALVGLNRWGRALGYRLHRRMPHESAERAPEAINEGRRQALAGLAFPAVTLSLGGWGSLQASAGFVTKEVELPIRNWPKALDGFRIGQITDTHVGDFVSVRTVKEAVDALNRERVHLQVMTGDLIDDLYYLEPTFDALERCQAPYGMLAVLGNHEKMRGRLRPVLSTYAARRQRGLVRLLVDESEVIQHNGTPLRVIGVDYPMRENSMHSLGREERMALMKQSARRTFGALHDETAARLCLSHHPEFFPLAAERGVGVTLSGHTHGGQIAVFGESLFPIYDYMLGHYSLGDSHLYVSGGTGHWLPYRVGVPTEVTVITIRSGY